MPSIVVRSAPFAWAANNVQDFTDMPFISTVQAPQCEVSQPICGPVRFSSSRRKWISRVRGSTKRCTFLPLTVTVTGICSISLIGFSSVGLSGAGALGGAGECTLHHDAGHLGAVFSRPASVGRRIGDRFCGCDRIFDGGIVKRGSGQDRACIRCIERRVRNIGQRDRAAGNRAAVFGEE